MPQERKHASRAHRQAAYRARTELARNKQLREKRLPALPPIPTMPGTARWNAGVLLAEQTLSMVIDEMRHYFDDRSEEWQESERGDEHQQRIESIEEALETVSGVTQ